ncbi:hypothetical protein AGOR_G00155580, partial [Albula goreensis]
MVPYSIDTDAKHNLKKIGRKYVFSIKDLTANDAGLYQVDVDDANVFSTDFKIVPVEFIVKIQEVKAMEREDAVFECVLSHPFPKIVWVGKNLPLEKGEKYDITVSEDMLIHKLVVKDCMQVDKGIYTAIAGITSCSAWLMVQANDDRSMHGKKAARKTTCAGAGGADLEKIAKEQQAKLQKERDDAEAARRAKEAQDAADKANAGSGDGGDGSGKDGAGGDGFGINGVGDDESAKDGSGKDGSESGMDGAINDGSGLDGAGGDKSGKDGTGNGSGGDGSAGDGTDGKKKRTRTGPLVPDTVIDPGVHFVSGLEDVNAIK